MYIKEAIEIVDRYGACLENVSKSGGYPIYPISALPYPKEKIKAALRTCLIYSASNRTLTKQYKGHLEVGYLLIADFVNDEDANLIQEWSKALKQTRLKLADKVDISELNKSGLFAKDWKRAYEIIDLAAKEGETLQMELKDLRAEFSLE